MFQALLRRFTLSIVVALLAHSFLRAQPADKQYLIKAGLFYDTALSKAYSIQTVGADLSVVFNALRIRTPLEAGVRTTYNTNTGAVLISPLVIDIGF